MINPAGKLQCASFTKCQGGKDVHPFLENFDNFNCFSIEEGNRIHFQRWVRFYEASCQFVILEDDFLSMAAAASGWCGCCRVVQISIVTLDFGQD